ncbi:MAG: MBL fold metallo-hydrolase [Phototrophicaceae bacterium]
MIENIKWLGHGSFAIQGTPSIYIDPWRIVREAFYPDIILISHEHYDHCSIADIQKLRGAETIILGNEKVAEKIDGISIIRPWQSMTFDRVSIKAIPAYAPDGIHHKESDGGLGFVISMNYYDIYYAGDTKLIPEMSRISPDIVILPIDNRDTLTIQEAVEVVDLLSPRWVIPSNWGSIGEGASIVDANEFKKQVGGRATVIIPDSKNPI